MIAFRKFSGAHHTYFQTGLNCKIAELRLHRLKDELKAIPVKKLESRKQKSEMRYQFFRFLAFQLFGPSISAFCFLNFCFFNYVDLLPDRGAGTLRRAKGIAPNGAVEPTLYRLLGGGSVAQAIT